MDLDILQYNPFSSFIGPEFWHKFTQIKLDIDKLDGHRKNIWGSYCFLGEIGNFLEVNYSAFNSHPDIQNNMCLGYGVLINNNTIEEFKECDKVELLNREGNQLWKDIENGTCLENPSSLSRFFILSFADLKKYHYFYWFAFPAPNNPFVYQSSKPTTLVEVFDQKQIALLLENHKQLDLKQKSFFCVNIIDDLLNIIPVAKAVKTINEQNYLDDNMYFAFVDPSCNEFPGWVLRNFIALLIYKCPSIHGKKIKIISLRLTRNGDFQHSLLFTIQIPEREKIEWGKNWVGWERNDKGNFGPRFSNMATSMNPEILAETSVDLNLKLMKWRLLPNLNLTLIKETKCLLLGAGTLGCSVARNLLAWGVRNITLVDSGKVSFSNPVRQNLFNHEDCLNGGKSKALAAADNLKKIFPGVNSVGTVLHIPMPGHPVGEALKNNTEKDLTELINLISIHDIIFLLLDSREARWLPTLIAAHFNKVVINAALGFDSYLIMRHGNSFGNDELNSECSIDEMKQKFIPGNQLGCYFCNDVTSPGNSQKERTLDQQCTVTRPGVSNIAGALATELAIAITQHEKGINAPAPYNFTGDVNDDESILGAVPHSIRGFLINYQQILPSCRKFKQCIACSSSVLENYRTNGNSFLMEVFNNAKYLEEITGLTNLHSAAEIAEVWALDESDIDE